MRSRGSFLALGLAIFCACGHDVVPDAPLISEMPTTEPMEIGQETSDPTVDTPIETEMMRDVPRASCDEPLQSALPLPDTVAEAQSGIEAELDSMDLDSLPIGIDLSSTSHLQRGVLAYMLDLAPAELDRPIPRSLIESRGMLGKAVLGAVKRARDIGDPGVDFTFLRRGLHRYYACESRFPTTLHGFLQVEGDFTHQTPIEIDSRPKHARRKLYTLADRGIFAAQSIIDGQVRETEILITGRRIANAIDFVVYDASGMLADRSTFATSAGGQRHAAAPYACLTCHYDPSSGRFDVVFPD